MPKVSVIVPTYNCAKYISEALDSVLAQTYNDYEIIIIDDGSTDNTKRVAEEAISRQLKAEGRKPRAIKYICQENKGPGAARNKGIKEAKGEYVAFLDADDLLYKDSLRLRSNFLDKYPDIGLVFNDYYLITSLFSNKGQAVLAKKRFLESIKDVIRFKENDEVLFTDDFYYKFLSFTPYPISMNAVMMKQRAIKDVGLFREDIFVGEDIDYWFRVCKKSKIGFINKPLAAYNRVFSQTTNDIERNYSNSLIFLKDIYASEKNPQIRAQVKERLAENIYELGYYYRGKNIRHKAIRCLIKSIFYDPGNFKYYKVLFSTLIPSYFLKMAK